MVNADFTGQDERVTYKTDLQRYKAVTLYLSSKPVVIVFSFARQNNGASMINGFKKSLSTFKQLMMLRNYFR